MGGICPRGQLPEGLVGEGALGNLDSTPSAPNVSICAPGKGGNNLEQGLDKRQKNTPLDRASKRKS